MGQPTTETRRHGENRTSFSDIFSEFSPSLVFLEFNQKIGFDSSVSPCLRGEKYFLEETI